MRVEKHHDVDLPAKRVAGGYGMGVWRDGNSVVRLASGYRRDLA
jgi:hypothetical protein